MVSIQSSHTSPSKCKCFSPFGNLMSCSLLTPQLCSHNCLSCGDIICDISCFYSLGSLSCGDVICGTITVCLTVWTIGGTSFTTIGTLDGSILPFIIFYALKFVLSYSLFTFKPEVSPSSILLFLLRTLLGKFATTFFLFFSAICIFFLLTLVGGLCGLSL